MEPKPIKQITQLLKQLPGVGQKTAQRYAHALKNFSEQDITYLIQNLSQLKSALTYCQRCFATIDKQAEKQLCSICSNPKRNRRLLCVVADEQELEAMEQTDFNGSYFVLGGLIEPRSNQKNSGPRLRELKQLIKKTRPQEIILALSPGGEGAATFLMLKKELSPFKIPLTKLGMGLPTEADLRYADKQTLEGALSSRAPL